MAFILMALMVAVLVLLEYLRLRRRRRAVSSKEAVEKSRGPLIVVNVKGFAVPQGIAYHPLHTWASAIDMQTARIGIDDLARRLIGRVDRIVHPMTGIELEQGQSSTLLGSNKRLAAVVSPIAGEIIEVNKELLDNPQLVSSDPYGRGWMFKIRSWRLAEQLSGLLAGNTARRWMEASAQRMRTSLGEAFGSVAQDGGELVEDLGSQLGSELWERLVREFLGTESSECE